MQNQKLASLCQDRCGALECPRQGSILLSLKRFEMVCSGLKCFQYQFFDLLDMLFHNLPIGIKLLISILGVRRQATGTLWDDWPEYY